MANPFKRASKTKPAVTGGNWIVDGDYDFLIENLVMRENGFKGDSFVAELYVERAKQTDPDVKPNQEGSSASYARVLSSDFQYQLMMALMFQVGVATGDDLNDMSTEEDPKTGKSELEEWLEYACGKEQPCRGVRISGRTRKTKTKKGDVITAIHWTAKPQDEAEIAANRKKLDD
jgi:hypothetical protein